MANGKIVMVNGNTYRAGEGVINKLLEMAKESCEKLGKPIIYCIEKKNILDFVKEDYTEKVAKHYLNKGFKLHCVGVNK